MKIKSLFTILLISIFSLILTACGAEAQEQGQTYRNRQTINDQIPVPSLSYSSRRLTLAKYYLLLNERRLPTCTYMAGRGSFGEALIPTFGPAVNLSDQMTSPTISEPDTVYSGTKDQTVLVLRNGNFTVAELDTVNTGGDCMPGLRANSLLQQQLEYASGIKPQFDFTTTDGLK